MRRRLSVAMAAVSAPNVVMLDEPTTGLDPETKLALWRLFHQLRDGGALVLLTTHDMHEASVLSDRVAVLANGRVLDLGSQLALKVQHIRENTQLSGVTLVARYISNAPFPPRRR